MYIQEGGGEAQRKEGRKVRRKMEEGMVEGRDETIGDEGRGGRKEEGK